jgi:hypothetical protein
MHSDEMFLNENKYGEGRSEYNEEVDLDDKLQIG